MFSYALSTLFLKQKTPILVCVVVVATCIPTNMSWKSITHLNMSLLPICRANNLNLSIQSEASPTDTIFTLSCRWWAHHLQVFLLCYMCPLKDRTHLIPLSYAVITSRKHCINVHQLTDFTIEQFPSHLHNS